MELEEASRGRWERQEAGSRAAPHPSQLGADPQGWTEPHGKGEEDGVEWATVSPSPVT